MGPPPPASLPDEIVEEILLRIPPSHPETLARAAIAQKRWCRLVSGNGFRRAYRARHRLPPTLGFFCYPMDAQRFTSFVPTSSFRPKPHADFHKLRPVDARHGRVLLRSSQRSTTFPLVVWDPITRHQVALPRPRGLLEEWYSSSTVLCAAPAGSCDHLDCHRGHFIVVLIGQRGNNPSRLLSCVYSSQDAMGGPSKDDQPRAGASRDVQSCVASSLIRQGK